MLWYVDALRSCITLTYVIGLFSLHRCGWVHGDISANNILLFGDRAILSDLEFATCQGEIVEHNKIV